MRTLESVELALVSGGTAATPKAASVITTRELVAPGDDVKPGNGNGTGWCRGVGNLKAGEDKHHVACGVS